ncbi:MAG: hypothetical protein J07AB43_00500 [Candidatus Nanosalina sp. J07AB43]|jgi:hypothetical protein|nr:MAG: hypothetical protein J07AB43_00500 [Candidatus Nanosalina sp. J07AB43]
MVISAATAELLVFSGGVILEVFAVTTLLDDTAQVPRIQSIMFAIALSIVAVGYWVLGLMLPFLSVAIGSVIWTLVAIYRPTDGKYLGLQNILPIE